MIRGLPLIRTRPFRSKNGRHDPLGAPHTACSFGKSDQVGPNDIEIDSWS